MAEYNHTQYPGIDVTKFILCFFVIAIHSDINLYILAIAVPYFFIASGFFLGNTLNSANIYDNQGKIWRWVKKIAHIYITWSIIYLPFAIYQFSEEHTPVWKAAVLYVRNFLLVGENYLSWHLWYLLGCIVGGSIIYFWIKKKWNWNILFVISFVLFLIGKAIPYIDSHMSGTPLSTAVDVYYLIFNTTRNGIFIGLFYMMTGLIISTFAIPRGSGYWILFLSVLLFLSAGILTKSQWFIPFIATSIFLFSASINVEDRSQFKTMRKQSTVIYLTHMLFIACMRLFPCPEMNGLVCFAMAAICSSLLAVALTKINSLKSVNKILFYW